MKWFKPFSEVLAQELDEMRQQRDEAVEALRELTAEILALCPNHIDSLPCTECGDEDCIWTRARAIVARYAQSDTPVPTDACHTCPNRDIDCPEDCPTLQAARVEEVAE